MFFQWGIEQEAAIYLNASIVGLQARRSYVDSFVSGTSANLKRMNIASYPHAEVVGAIVKWTEQAVQDNGWNLCDEDGVAWFIGLIGCTNDAINEAFAETDYNTLFKECFVKYFKDK